MAFYQPSSAGVPQAPVAGGASQLAAAEINAAPPAFNAGESMMRAMEVGARWEEREKAKRDEGTQEATTFLDNELYDVLNTSSVPSSVGTGGDVDFSNLGQRKFTKERKQVALTAYKAKVLQEGGQFNARAFDQLWNSYKTQENQKILSDMYYDYKKGRVDADDFNYAARNPEFLEFYKDLGDESKQYLQEQLGHKLDYRTWGEVPGDILDDYVLSPLGLTAGATAAVGMGTETGRDLTKGAYERVTGVTALNNQRKELEDLKQKADDLSKRGSKKNPNPTWEFNQYKKSQEYKNYINLKKKKTLSPVDKEKLKKYQEKFDELKNKSKGFGTNKRSAKEAYEKAQAKYDDSLNKRKGRFGRGAARAGRGVLGYTAGSMLAEQVGLGGIGQLAGGVGGDITLSKVVKKLGDPAIRSKLGVILRKVAPSLAGRMAGSALLTGSGIGTALGIAGGALTAVQIFNLIRNNPELKSLFE